LLTACGSSQISRSPLASVCASEPTLPIRAKGKRGDAAAMTTNLMPKAKKERLIVRDLDGETLIYDRTRNARFV
jgi:hypothetical protein